MAAIRDLLVHHMDDLDDIMDKLHLNTGSLSLCFAVSVICHIKCADGKLTDTASRSCLRATQADISLYACVNSNSKAGTVSRQWHISRQLCFCMHA